SPKSNTTRRRLLETAWKLFASEGYAETTLRRIAQAAECSLGLSYRYFAVKEELVLALYYQILQDLEARAAELPAGTLAERFSALMRTKLQLIAPHRETLGALFVLILSPGHPLSGLGDQTEVIRTRGTAAFARAVLGASDAPADADVCQQLARSLYTAHLGLILLSFLDPTPARKLSDQALELLSDVLGLAGFLLASPLAGMFLPRIDAIVQPLLNLGSRETATLAERILRLIFKRRRLQDPDSPCAAEPCPQCLALHLPRVQYFVARDLPIHLILPAFPAKSPNPAKVLGDLPDLAEELSLVALQGLCDEIAAIYPPGARLTLCSDGRVFGDLVGVDDQTISRYGKVLDQWLVKLELSAIERFSLEDLYDGQDFDSARSQLLETYAEPIEQLMQRTREQPAQQALYNGIHRFLYEDRLGRVEVSHNQLRRQTRDLAWEVIRRSNAWTRLLGQCFPQALRLSIHPQEPHADKIGILLTRAADNWLTPWHGVAVLGEDGYSLMKRSQAEELGAKLVLRNRRPSHYSLTEEV
ncbi:MAG: L-tyrosine/L-tryptophan isonitrile synthase family protein, partial [Candidatus Sericytochromatia bacterium]